MVAKVRYKYLQRYNERFPTDPETIEKKVSEFIEYGKQMLKGLTIAYLK